MKRRFNKTALFGAGAAILLICSGCHADVSVDNTEHTIVEITTTETASVTDATTEIEPTTSEIGTTTEALTEADTEAADKSYGRIEFIKYLEYNNMPYAKAVSVHSFLVTEENENGEYHQYLYMLSDTTDTWEQLCELNLNASTRNKTIKQLIIAANRNDEICIAINADTANRLFFTRDYGESLDQLTIPSEVNSYIDIEALYLDDTQLLLGAHFFDYDKQAIYYQSTDLGESWQLKNASTGDLLYTGMHPTSFKKYYDKVICEMEYTFPELSESSNKAVFYVEEPDNKENISFVPAQFEGNDDDYTLASDNITFHRYKKDGSFVTEISWKGYTTCIDADFRGANILKDELDFDNDGESETIFYYETGARGSMRPYVLDISGGELICLPYEVPELEYEVLSDYRLVFYSDGMESRDVIDLSLFDYYVNNWYDKNGSLAYDNMEQYSAWLYTTYDIDIYKDNEGGYILSFGTEICAEAGAGVVSTLYSDYKLVDGELVLVYRGTH